MVQRFGLGIRERQNSLRRPTIVREEIPKFKSFIYSLEVEPNNNPLFSRVWYVRHTLNERSPLLKPEIRKRIITNHGRWPLGLRDPTSIRNALEFRQFVVTLNGSSMVTLEHVFYAKTYIFEVQNVFTMRSMISHIIDCHFKLFFATHLL